MSNDLKVTIRILVGAGGPFVKRSVERVHELMIDPPRLSHPQLQVVGRLKIEPILRRLAESAPKQQCQLRRNGPRTLDDMGDAHRCHAYEAREIGLGQVAFVEDFAKEFTRVDRRQTVLDHKNLRSMVIYDLIVVSVALLKAKTHPPLLVDADAPLAFAITLEGLHAIRRREFEIFNYLSCHAASRVFQPPFAYSAMI